jgi:isocitrate dehydrogenase kinase/phosphatase
VADTTDWKTVTFDDVSLRVPSNFAVFDLLHQDLTQGFLPDPGTCDDGWFYAGPSDVFPEQFPKFLGLSPPLMTALKNAHDEIFDPDWWRELQARLRDGDYPDTPPYPDAALLA